MIKRTRSSSQFELEDSESTTESECSQTDSEEDKPIVEITEVKKNVRSKQIEYKNSFWESVSYEFKAKPTSYEKELGLFQSTISIHNSKAPFDQQVIDENSSLGIHINQGSLELQIKQNLAHINKKYPK